MRPRQRERKQSGFTGDPSGLSRDLFVLFERHGFRGPVNATRDTLRALRIARSNDALSRDLKPFTEQHALRHGCLPRDQRGQLLGRPRTENDACGDRTNSRTERRPKAPHEGGPNFPLERTEANATDRTSAGLARVNGTPEINLTSGYSEPTGSAETTSPTNPPAPIGADAALVTDHPAIDVQEDAAMPSQPSLLGAETVATIPTEKRPKKRRAKAGGHKVATDTAWVPVMLAAVEDLRDSAIDDLDTDELLAVARWHAYALANCTKSERTNLSNSRKIARSLADLVDVVRRKCVDLTVGQYREIASKFWSETGKGPWYTPIDLKCRLVESMLNDAGRQYIGGYGGARRGEGATAQSPQTERLPFWETMRRSMEPQAFEAFKADFESRIMAKRAAEEAEAGRWIALGDDWDADPKPQPIVESTPKAAWVSAIEACEDRLASAPLISLFADDQRRLAMLHAYRFRGECLDEGDVRREGLRCTDELAALCARLRAAKLSVTVATYLETAKRILERPGTETVSVADVGDRLLADSGHPAIRQLAAVAV